MVHLRTGSNSINSHEEELLRLDLAEKMLDIVEDLDEHLFFGHSESRIVGILVRTVVDDLVHVKLVLLVSDTPSRFALFGQRLTYKQSNSGILFSVIT